MTVDVEQGQDVPVLRATANACSMMLVTLITGDPNPIHFDTGATARLDLGDRPVNQGAITMAYPINAVLAWLQPDWRLERSNMRFRGNVFAGDTVDVGGRVLEVDRGLDRVTARIAVWVRRVDTQDVVLDGEIAVIRRH